LLFNSINTSFYLHSLPIILYAASSTYPIHLQPHFIACKL
jgi:hypothetical protein